MTGGPPTVDSPPFRVGAAPVPMTDMEIAWGWVGGTEDHRPAPLRSLLSPLRALEDAIRPALRRPPCLVEFSGGRDSSAVLAVACSLARSEGLPLPVPVTQRFPGVAEADETGWQEELIGHLGVTDWVRRDVSDELDLVGPVAGPSLRRHGTVWPPLGHTRGAIWQLAPGGSVVTGEGGDEVLGPRRLTPLRQLLARDAPATRPNIRAAALCLAPGPVRSRALAAPLSRAVAPTWLRPEARDGLLRAAIQEAAAEPLDRRRALAGHLCSRRVRLALHNLAAMASCLDVALHHPMLDPGFVAAVAATARFLGPRDRTAAMRSIFGGLLPDAVLARRSKARFNRVHFGEHSRAFVETFSGDGVDHDLVDAERLLEAWRAPVPHAMTSALLQACWLAGADRRASFVPVGARQEGSGLLYTDRS